MNSFVKIGHTCLIPLEDAQGNSDRVITLIKLLFQPNIVGEGRGMLVF
jgi:hypothetical protein